MEQILSRLGSSIYLKRWTVPIIEELVDELHVYGLTVGSVNYTILAMAQDHHNGHV